MPRLAPKVVVRTRMKGRRRAVLELHLINVFLPILGDERGNRWALAAFNRVTAWAQVDGGEWQRVR